MKIKHSELEKLRRDPNSFKYTQGVNSERRNFSYATALRLSVFYFHKEQQNQFEAHQYLQNTCERNFKNAKRIENLHICLDNYISSFDALNHTVITTKYRLNATIFQNLILGGEISRIDLELYAPKYYAYIFTHSDDDWKYQLRMPIIQYALSKEFNCSTKDINIGICDFSTFDHKSKSYAKSEINNAKNELLELYREIS